MFCALLLFLLSAPGFSAPQGVSAGQDNMPLVEKLQRDELLSFGGDSAPRALRGLESDKLSTRRHAVCLMALGCARADEELERLEATARDPERDLELRRAAVLALGEAGPSGVQPLLRLAELGISGLDVHVAIALVRCGSSKARNRVLQAAGGEGPLANAGRFCADYARSGSPPWPSPAFDLLLTLRWEAAREFGFVSNRRWREVAFEELLLDQEFLHRTVLIASIEPPSPSVQDHLYAIVLEGTEKSRLRPAVLAMPVALARMMEEDLWHPRGGEWEVLLEEIEDRDRERECVDLLWIALERLDVRYRAGLMLLRAGQLPSREWLTAELEEADTDRVREIVQAIGEGGDSDQLEVVLSFANDAFARELEAAALVAAARLEHGPARERLREVITGEAGSLRDGFLMALAEAAGERRFQSLLVDALARGEIAPEVRFRLELALALAGRLRTRHELAGWLSKDVRSQQQRHVVRALGPRADRAEFEGMRELFPVQDDLDLNVELALMLIRYRDPWGIRLLQTALWESPFHESVLAGGLLARTGGLNTLIGELDSPPATASARDLRRVGFAIGEWGGIPAVEALSRRRGVDDPAMQGAYLGALSVRTQ